MWRWIDGKYFAASAYQKMQEGITKLQRSSRIWKNWTPPKVKFFTWLATKGKLWIADRQRRHNLEAHDVCWLCEQEHEMGDHILMNSSYTKQIWWGALSWLGRACTFLDQPSSLQDRWSHGRRLQLRGMRSGFDTLFILIIWRLWKERNVRLFNDCPSTVQHLLKSIREESELWIQAGAHRLKSLKGE